MSKNSPWDRSANVGDAAQDRFRGIPSRPWPTPFASFTAAVNSLVRRPHLSGPNWDYQRFVVLGYPRCGTTMLVSALNKHSRIMCYGEIFHPRAFERRRLGLLNRSVRARIFKKLVRDLMPATYIHTNAYYGYMDRINAVGFKLMASHLIDFRRSFLVEYLLSHDDIKLLHIWRRNTLERYLSRIVARSFPATYSSRATPVRPSAVGLDPGKCEADFMRVERRKEFIERTFTGPRLLTTTYERLVENPHEAYREIQQHIGVEVEAIEPGTRKQGIWPREELISNYDELVSHFAGTRWGYCFTRESTNPPRS